MQSVLSAVDDKGVATVTLNKPENHNAFDDLLLAELHKTITELGNDDSVRILVLQAMGKSFSAGADLNWMRSMASYSKEENYQDALAMAHFFRDLAILAKPTLALVQGAALGGGMGLVACCDIAIADKDAKFGLAEVKLGLIPAVISPYVRHAIGHRNWQRYAMTGERFSAEEARRIGLVQLVASREKLSDTFNSLCSGLLQNSPAAMRAVKEKLMGYERMDLEKICEDTAEAIAALRVSEEGREGIAAFLEKRQPGWRIG